MTKYYFFFNEGSKINQLICAVLINLPLFAYGASIGWMSPMTLLLQSKDSPTGRPLTDTEISWMASAAYIVCCPSDFGMAFLGDRIGRKYSLLFITSTLAACWIVKLSSLEISAFIVARVLVGINMAGCFVVCPIYTKEISQDSIRGFLGSMGVLFQTTGNLFAYILGDLLSYNTFLWACLAIPTLHLILFMTMPESPSYLLKRGNVEEATRVLAWLRCRDEDDTVVKTELETLRKEQEKDMEGSKFLLKDILSDRLLRRAFIIAIVVTQAREVCGAIPVLGFAGDIFAMASKGTSLVLTPNQQAMMLGAVQVAGSLLASSVVEKAGRKMLLFVTSLISGLSMCCFATWFLVRSLDVSLPAWIPVVKFDHMLLFVTSLISGLSMCCLATWFLVRSLDISSPAWIPVVTLCVSIFCDASGLQPVSMVLTGEIVSFKYRGTVMAATMATASFSAFLQMLFFKPLATAIGAHVAFYFFAAICISAAIYVLIFIPETRNKTLDQIYDALKTKKEKMKEKEMNKSEGC